VCVCVQGEPFDLTLWRGGQDRSSAANATVSLRVRAYARRLAGGQPVGLLLIQDDAASNDAMRKETLLEREMQEMQGVLALREQELEEHESELASLRHELQGFYEERARARRANTAVFDFTHGAFRSSSYLATSFTESTASRFLAKPPPPGNWVKVLWEFHFDRTRKCLHANFISGIPNTMLAPEAEILLPPYSVLAVRSVEPATAHRAHYKIVLEVSPDNVDPPRDVRVAPAVQAEPLGRYG